MCMMSQPPIINIALTIMSKLQSLFIIALMEIKRDSKSRKDNRRPVEQRRPEPPFQSIGRLQSHFAIDNKRTVPFTSTAFVIGKNLIMTSIQSLYKPQFGGKAKSFHFFPFKSNQPIKPIIVMPCNRAETIYRKNQSESIRKYWQNFMVILLEPNETMQKIKPLQINWQFDLEEYVQEQIIIPGYSYDLSDQSSRNRQFFTLTKPLRQKRSYLYYDHVGALTGCPVILKKQKYGYPTKYEVIGIHNSHEKIQADGILFTTHTKQNLTEVLEDLKCVDNFPQKLEYSKSKLLKQNLMLAAISKKIFAQLKDAQKNIAHLEACNQLLLKNLDEEKHIKQEEMNGMNYALKTFKNSGYYLTPQQQINKYERSSNIRLNPHRYTLDHAGVKLQMNIFFMYDWSDLQELRLQKCEMGNKEFWDFLQSYRLFPKLVILDLSHNSITTLPKQIENLNTIEELNLTENPLSQSSISYIQLQYKNTVKNVFYTKKSSAIDLVKDQNTEKTDELMSQ